MLLFFSNCLYICLLCCMVLDGTLWYGTVGHGAVCYSMVRYGTVRYGLV